MESVTFVKIDSSADTATDANSLALPAWKNVMSMGGEYSEFSLSLYGLQFDGYLIVKRPFLSLNIFHFTSAIAKDCPKAKVRTMLIRAATETNLIKLVCTKKCKS